MSVTDRDQPPGWPKSANSKEECCKACIAQEGCAAAVMSDPPTTNGCWFKSEEDIKFKGTPCCGKQTIACTPKDDVPPAVKFTFRLTWVIVACCSVYIIACVLVNKFARGKTGWSIVPHATFFREFGGLLYDGVAFTMAGFKVPRSPSEGLLASSEDQAQSESPQLAGVDTDAKSSTSVNPAEFAALVESGEIASITTKARRADERDLKAALDRLGMPTDGSKQELRARLEQAAAERRAKIPRGAAGSLLWRDDK